jgi:hypothetical protein
VAEEPDADQLRAASDQIFAAAGIPTDIDEAFNTFFEIYTKCLAAGFTEKQALWITAYGIWGVGNV